MRPWRAVHYRKTPPIRVTLRMLYSVQRGYCAYCNRRTALPPRDGGRIDGVLYASRDHRHPRARGGGDARGNLVMACEPCNRLKADMLWPEWRAFMTANPAWWEVGAAADTLEDA